MALLDSFKYSNFILAEEAATTTESKGGGLPRFGGETHKLSEYCWRVRARITRENLLPEDERKKLGPLGLRLVEGLNGAALRVAQMITTTELAGDKGAEMLLERLIHALQPRRIQEARELYLAGAQQNGMLSRQHGEPMSTYLVRRQAWYHAMTDLNKELKLPELILAENTLTNAGISDTMQLLIRSAIQGDMTVDKITTELIAQHSKIHEKETRGGHRGKGHGKHWKDYGNRQRHGYVAEEFEEDWNYEAYQSYEPDTEDASAYDEATNYEYETYMSWEGADECLLLAMLASDGLDLDDEESMEYAADVIQAEMEVHYARDRAISKGIKGFKGGKSKGKGKPQTKHFDVSGQLSLTERRLQLLKSRTTCRKCFQIGHWSGDPSCPKGSGKGKSPSSGATSNGKGNGKSPPKTRTVYFAVQDYDNKNPRGYMAQRYNAVPPPSSLQDGQYVTPQGSPEPTLAPTPERRDLASQLVPVTQVSEGAVLTTDELDNFMLVSALGVSETRDDGRVIYEIPEELLGSGIPGQLDGYGLSDVVRNLPRLPERLGLLEQPAPHAQVQPSVLQPDAVLTSSQVSPPVHAAQAPHAEPGLPSDVPQPASGPRCQHVRTTSRGTNGYYLIKRCADCGVMLSREPRVPESSTPAPKASSGPRSSGECQHQSVSWSGTNAFRWRRTCKDCGEVRTGPVANSERTSRAAASSSGLGLSSATPGLGLQRPVRTSSFGMLTQVIQHALTAKRTSVPQSEFVSASELHLLLDYAIGVVSMHELETGQTSLDLRQPVSATPSEAPPPSTPMSSVPTTTALRSPGSQAEHLEELGMRQVTFGKFKGQTFYQAWCDSSYVQWALDEEENVKRSGRSLGSGLKQLCHYFREMQRRPAPSIPATGFMALTDSVGSEDDLIAILDTGCNATCHGSHWYDRFVRATGCPDAPLQECIGTNMKGIGGNLSVGGKRFLEVCFELSCGSFARGTLPSLELQNSKAPLLLSLESQRQLGFTIDIPNHNVYSTALNSNLKLVQRDGLLAIRLIPNYLGLSCTVDEDGGLESPAVPMPGSQLLDPEHGNEANHAEEEEQLPLTPEVHLAVDELQKTSLTKGQKKQLHQTIHDVKDKDSHLWSCLRAQHGLDRRPRVLPRGCKTVILEVFAGAAMLSLLATEFGLPVSQPVDLSYDGIDLKLKQHRDLIDQQIEAEDPYCISLSPLCGPWSSWRRINLAKGPNYEDKLIEVRREWRPVVQWMCQLIRRRLNRGRQVIFEQPWPSAMWNLLSLHQRLLQEAPCDAATGEPLEAIRCDQCMFGLKDAYNDLPHKKPTGIMTASAGVKERIGVTCSGDHQHQQLEGSNRTTKAQCWLLASGIL